MVVLIGVCLTNGNCYAISDEEYFNVTMKKAQSGDVEAQFNIGYMYKNGIGIKQDDNESFKWFKKAKEWYEVKAKEGSVKAQFMLGIMYNEGFGVKKNLSLSKDWFEKSCNNGNQQGCKNYKYLNDAGY